MSREHSYKKISQILKDHGGVDLGGLDGQHFWGLKIDGKTIAVAVNAKTNGSIVSKEQIDEIIRRWNLDPKLFL